MFRSFLLAAFLASSLSITGVSSFHVRSSVRITRTVLSAPGAGGLFTILGLFFYHHAQQVTRQTSSVSARDSLCNKARKL